MNKEELLFLQLLSEKEDRTDCENIDFSKLLSLAEEHSVLPIVYERLCEISSFQKENFPEFQRRAFGYVMFQAKRTREFEKIYSILLESGISPIIMKGLVCRSLYGDLCDHRPSSDEDIFVKEEDFFKLHDILVENEYEPEFENISKTMLKTVQEVTFKNKKCGLVLEVHLNPIGLENTLRQKMNGYFKNAFDSMIQMNINGKTYYTMEYTQNFIYLFFHLFRHFCSAGVGIRQVIDVLKFAEKYRESIDWNTVYAAVSDVSADRFFSDIFEIGNRYLGFSNEVKFPLTSPEVLLGNILKTGTFGNSTPEQAGSRVMVTATIDAGNKFKYLKAIFPSVHLLRGYYTVLYKHPYLLPFIWVKRWLRYINRVIKGEKKSVSKSRKFASEKIELMKMYGII